MILLNSLLFMAALISMAILRPVEIGLPYVQTEYSEPSPKGLVPATIRAETSNTVNPVVGEKMVKRENVPVNPVGKNPWNDKTVH